MANKLDIIVLAGKGHEPYQEINGEKLPYDERIIVKKIIDNDISSEKKIEKLKRLMRTYEAYEDI